MAARSVRRVNLAAVPRHPERPELVPVRAPAVQGMRRLALLPGAAARQVPEQDRRPVGLGVFPVKRLPPAAAAEPAAFPLEVCPEVHCSAPLDWRR